MPTEDSAPSRRIMLSGLAAGGLTPNTAISLVDDAGSTLQRAVVNADGSCEVHENALWSAQEVHFGPVNVSLTAEQLRTLIGTENTLDIAALLLAASVPEAPVKKRGIAHIGEHDRKDR